ncbi:hypothetical protein EVAR_44001_1 [Eumeta japonica]|uniref:Ig-like domain-containing protein n=1 Tax=Eumeta variegata TaxID=151549 RepID=A0A4C1XEL4_EUMVA|nr:hypothetical protein EVAR_44001_1 [Eumeta japonica]
MPSARLDVYTCCAGACAGHTITSLWVPRWAEPGRAAELRCQYARQPRDPPLHSVKWYRNNDEIFRYTPHEMWAEGSPHAFTSSKRVKANTDAHKKWKIVVHVDSK